jgi:hypothetical protein
MVTKQKRAAGIPTEASLSVEIDALAKMIEYSSVEARQHGLLLTSHLLDLAVWSLKEARPEGTQPGAGPDPTRVIDKPN